MPRIERSYRYHRGYGYPRWEDGKDPEHQLKLLYGNSHLHCLLSLSKPPHQAKVAVTAWLRCCGWRASLTCQISAPPYKGIFKQIFNLSIVCTTLPFHFLPAQIGHVTYFLKSRPESVILADLLYNNGVSMTLETSLLSIADLLKS